MAGIITALLLRLLLLLSPLLPHAVREQLSASHRRPPEDWRVGGGATDELHPIILVPGLGCSDLDARLTEAYRPSVARCGAMKGKGWFGVWDNASDLVAHDYVECFLEQTSLVYDPIAGDYQNLPGVETRVLHFGSASGFHDKNPYHRRRCFDDAREALERIGYRDGDTLFGAPYDFRYAPPSPGQPSQAYSGYFEQLARLVETASERSNGKKVILFGHSLGGMVALEFVRGTAMAWRERHIKHLVLAAPTLATGLVQQVKALVSGPSEMIYVPGHAGAAAVRAWWRSFEAAVVNLPSPEVFGRGEPLVVTARRNYSAREGDMEELLAAVGFAGGVEPFRARAVPRMRRCFEAPMVPMTCVNGVGVRTPRQLVYREGGVYDGASPEVVYGDGDGFVNSIAMQAFDEAMQQQPGQIWRFKSVKVPNAQHSSLIMDEWSLKQVIHEIIEANRVT
ncbi:hypothetical protein ACP4OV_018406 [Aristida adscensionis]